MGDVNSQQLLERYRQQIAEAMVQQVITMLEAQDRLRGREFVAELSRTFLTSFIATTVYLALRDVNPNAGSLSDPLLQERLEQLKSYFADCLRVGLENGISAYNNRELPEFEVTITQCQAFGEKCPENFDSESNGRNT